jgi:hypothetical protein
VTRHVRLNPNFRIVGPYLNACCWKNSTSRQPLATESRKNDLSQRSGFGLRAAFFLFWPPRPLTLDLSPLNPTLLKVLSLIRQALFIIYIYLSYILKLKSRRSSFKSSVEYRVLSVECRGLKKKSRPNPEPRTLRQIVLMAFRNSR